MRAVLLGVLAAALLSQDADAQFDMSSSSANFYVPACQKFQRDRLTRSDEFVEAGSCAGLVEG